MKVLNLGSLNLDYVYNVDHMMMVGETQASLDMNIFCGGKGLNQSIALAKAGVPVYHAGLIGEDGQMLLENLEKHGVNTRFIQRRPGKGGHTIIQVDKNAQNCILLYGGTNRQMTEDYIDEVLAEFETGDLLILQNEVNLLAYIIDSAYRKGMKIVLNPSPFDSNLDHCDFGKISMLILNEVEGWQVTGEKDPDRILEVLRKKYPDTEVILTLGEEGSVYRCKEVQYRQGIFKVKAVDTTAAGDTYTGYFLSGIIDGKSIPEALEMAACASSIAVSGKGAADSIPLRNEVEEALRASHENAGLK